MLSQQLFKINQLMQQQAFTQALTALHSLLLVHPKSADIFKLLGICFLNSQGVDEGIKALEKSLVLFDKQPELHAFIADIYKKRQLNSLALGHFQKAAQYDKNNHNYYRELGFIHNRLQQPKLALQAFEQALKLAPTDINALIGKGSSLSDLHQEQAAIDIFKQVLAKKIDNFIALYNLALCYKKVGDLEEGIKTFKHCLQLNNKALAVYENIAALLLENGNVEQSIDHLKKGLSLNAYEPALNRSLSNLLWELKADNFLAHYQQLPFEQMSLTLLLDYFYQLIKADRLTEAKTLLAKIIGKFDNISEVIIATSQLYYQLKEYRTAYEQLTAIQTQRALNNSELDWLGRHCLALGKYNQATDVYKTLTEHDSRNQGYWCLYSTALRETDYNAYKKLIDYDNLVFPLDIELPQGFASIDEFNQQLMQALAKQHITKQHPLAQSLHGGTQTLGRIFNRPDKIFKLLEQAITAAITKATATIGFDEAHPTKKYQHSAFDFTGAWSVWLKSAGFHHNHYHSLGWYSGVYYINLPAEHELKNGAGYLKLGQPDLSLPTAHDADFLVKPKVGQLVLFPSFLWHGTEPFQSSQPRVTIAFDVAPKL